MAAVEVPAPPQLPELRPPNIEVIDVDALLDQQPEVTPRQPNGSLRMDVPLRVPRRTPEVIELIGDSDDEAGPSQTRRPMRPLPRRHELLRPPRQTVVIGSDSEDDEWNQPTQAQMHQGRRRRLLSPPPPPRSPGNGAPPVPPIPRVLPPRRVSLYHHHHSNNNNGPPARRTSLRLDGPPQQRPADVVAPRPILNHRDRPRPNLGLGGAILAGPNPNSRRGAGGAQNRLFNVWQDMLDMNHWQQLFIGGRDGAGGIFDDDDDDGDFDDDVGLLDDFDLPFRPYARAEAQRRAAAAKEMEYKTEYTHPVPPAQGFTFDFCPKEKSENTRPMPRPPVKVAKEDAIVIDDEPIVIDVDAEVEVLEVPKSEKPVLPLQCARCRDAMVLTSSGAFSPEEERRKRAWGLRCGHVIDGKCLEEIGHGKETERVPLLVPEEVVPTKGKGKGRAKPYVDVPVPAASTWNPLNSMRSRLRSSATTSASTQSNSYSSPSRSGRGAGPPPIPGMPPMQPHPPVHPSSAAHRGRKRKRGGKEPVVEEVHVFSCPVEGCGREHASWKVEGRWVPEREGGRGAIAMFV